VGNNFTLGQDVYGEDVFALDIVSQELCGKVPVVVVSNDLVNYNFINKDNRPLNLLYNTFSGFETSSFND